MDDSFVRAYHHAYHRLPDQFAAVRQELDAAPETASAARLHRKIGALHWESGDRERVTGRKQQCLAQTFLCVCYRTLLST